jgi:hypothetical protein
MLKPLAAALALAAAGLPLAPAAHADKPPIYTGVLSNVAVGGYDPVAYFREGKPVRGVAANTTMWKGAEFRFSSVANRDAFLADPERFAPQYGGYCAWAVSQGYTAKGDPRFWKVVDGKLYLNFDAKVQERWEADVPGFVRMADGNWPGVLD